MVDVDGVLIKHPDPAGWSAHLERDLGIAQPLLQRVFFERHWDDVIHGRAALRDRLTPVLAEIGPTVSYETFVDYWFSHDAHLDHGLLAELSALRGNGVEIHLATVQEHERADYLWRRLNLRDSFDAIHYAAAMKCAKPDPAFYRAVETATGLAPAAIFFIDDKLANVLAGRGCGWTAELWTGQQTLRALIDNSDWPLSPG